MIKFKNPESKSNKKSTNKDKSKKIIMPNAPFMEYVLRMFYILAFVSLTLCVFYLFSAVIGGISGYFMGSVGISMEISVMEMLKNIDLYSIVFVFVQILFFVVMCIAFAIFIIKSLFGFFIRKKLGNSIRKYKKAGDGKNES